MSETCTVRPELLEFDKGANQFLSIVAYPEHGFKFTKTTTSTAGVSDVQTEIQYDNGNLADLYAQSLHVGDIEVSTIANLENLSMIGDGSGIVDMNGGNIEDLGILKTRALAGNSVLIYDNKVDLNQTGDVTQVNQMTFFEAGETNVLTVSNDSILFGNSDGLLDMNNGNVTNVQYLSLYPDGMLDAQSGTVKDLEFLKMSAGGTAEIDVNQGNIVDVKRMELGNLVFSDVNQIYNKNAGDSVELENVLFQDRNVSSVNHLTFVDTNSTLDMADGNVNNVDHINMITGNGTVLMNGGTIDFGDSAGNFNLQGASAVARIGELTLSTNTIQNASGNVHVEQSIFTNTTIHTQSIQKLGGGSDVHVFDAQFTEDRLTVTNVDTDEIRPKAPATDADLTLKAKGTGTVKLLQDGTSSNMGLRITNLLNPVGDFDAANKAYVKEAVEQNIQGLKPKKACDVSLDADNWTKDASNNNFGTYQSYMIAHHQSYDANIGDTSTLILYLQDNDSTSMNGNVEFDGVLFTKDQLNESKKADDDHLLPAIPKIRVLFNGLNNVSYAGEYGNKSTDINKKSVPANYNIIANHDSNIEGFNGIWEVLQMENEQQINSQFYYKLTFQRALDMNQDHEVVNGAYVYVKDGTSTRKNMGFVVSNADPLTIDKTTGLTVGDGGVREQLQWVEFNQVNYELDFVGTDGLVPSINKAAKFAQGAIAMRYDFSDEKALMIDAELLKYDYSAESLQVKGNIDFNLEDSDAYINSKSEAYKVFVNGTEFESNADGPIIRTTDIIANTVTCESDRTLKKNIKPMENGLELVSKLKAVTYNWNRDEKCDNVEYGFIAQEVEEQFPSLVRTDATSGIKSVDYQKMVSLLAAAVQELSAMVLAKQ